MSYRFYDYLEETLRKLQDWKMDVDMQKNEVIDCTRERILNLMTHVISTPLIGTNFAYPGDLPNLQAWVESDAVVQ